MEFQGAIFDLDGTLVDSMWIWDDLVQRFLEGRGLSVPAGLPDRFKNMTFETSSEYVAVHFPLQMSPQEIQEAWSGMIFHYYERELSLKEGAEEYLHFLHDNGIKLVLATSNFRRTAEAFLENNGVRSLFEAVLISDEVGKNKQHPDIYLQAADALGVPPSNCMVFEDILVGVKTAKQAGMLVTAVEDGASIAEREKILKLADRYIKNYRQLLD